MEYIAKSKYIRTSPRKLRLVARALKGMFASQALVALANLDKRAALPVSKTIKSALSNATNNAKQKAEEMKIKTIQIDGGAIYKRIQPVSRGQAHSIQKRTSHITVILEEEPGGLRGPRDLGEKTPKALSAPSAPGSLSSLK